LAYTYQYLGRYSDALEYYDEAIGVTYNDVLHDPDAALHTLVEKHAELRERFDAVVIVGSDYTDVKTPTELTFNARVAATSLSSTCAATDSWT